MHLAFLSSFVYTPDNVRCTERKEGREMAQNGGFVAYYRVSTNKQGKSGLGLEAQRAAVANYLNGGNWRIVAEFTEVESGKRSDRPQLDKALAAARSRRVPLVVAKVDRLTRSVGFLSRLLDAGVDVRFADLPAIEGATGKFILQQMAAVAELEAGMISARTKAALAAAKRRGVQLGGFRGHNNLGSRERKAALAAKREKTQQWASDIAPIVKELQASGAVTLVAIADGLNERSVPTARGGQWSATQVMRLLAYSGLAPRPFEAASVGPCEAPQEITHQRPFLSH
jgi:DNA invertase Pin-like site-specific DNA recombinase